MKNNKKENSKKPAPVVAAGATSQASNPRPSSNSKPETKQLIHLQCLTLGHWLFLASVIVLAAFALWQFYLPFLAERHYRDGFNFDVSNRMKFAIEEYELAIKYAPWETQYMTNLGKALEKTAEYLQGTNAERFLILQRAERIYQEMVIKDDLNPWFKNRLSSIYFQMAALSDTPEQKAVYQKLGEENIFLAAENDPRNPLFQLNLAYYLHRTQRIAEAEQIYLKTLTMDPNMLEARYNLAAIYRDRNDLAQCLEQYQLIYQVNPNFPNVALALASMYLQREEPQNAKPYLEHVVASDPKNVDVLRNLATIYLMDKQYLEAATCYKNLIINNPDKEEAYHQFLIKALFYGGALENAQAELVDFLQRYPKNTDALKQLAAIQEVLREAKNRP